MHVSHFIRDEKDAKQISNEISDEMRMLIKWYIECILFYCNSKYQYI